jgi:hypothetical protein
MSVSVIRTILIVTKQNRTATRTMTTPWRKRRRRRKERPLTSFAVG